MAEFLYRVRNTEGRVFAGLLEAQDSRQLKQQLNSSGYYVVSLRPQAAKKFFFLPRHRSMDLDSLIMFTRQLASMLEAGMNIMTALDSIWKGMEREDMQIVVSQVRTRLSAGQSFSRAMEMTEAFPVFYRSLLVAGESGGGFVPILKKLLAYLENMREYKTKIKKATLYPAFVVAFAGVVLILMMVLVVPTFQKVFLKINAPLPPLTQFTIAVSQMLRSPWFWGGVALCLAGLYAAYVNLRKNRDLGLMLDRLKLRVPVLGKIFYLSSIERFVRTLGLLLGGGLTIITSLDVTRATLVNKEMEAALEVIRGKIIEGVALSTALRESDLFPAFLIEMVTLGEQTGTLPEVLQRSADHFYSEFDARVHNFLTLLEPALIVMVGGIVIFVLWSIYVPIFSLWEKIPKMR